MGYTKYQAPPSHFCDGPMLDKREFYIACEMGIRIR